MHTIEKIGKEFFKPLIPHLQPLSEDESRNKKNRFLYELASKLYDEEVQRFNDLEDKSAKLLTSLSIISLLYFPVVRWASGMIGDSQLITSIFISIIMIDVACFFRAWRKLKQAFMITPVPKLPLDEPLHELFIQDSIHINSIYYNLYQGYKEGISKYKKVNLEKSKNIEDGYKHLDYGFIGFMFILSFPVFYYIFQSI